MSLVFCQLPAYVSKWPQHSGGLKQCLNGWKPIKEYNGYNATFSDNSTGTTTALDWAGTGDTPDGYLPLATSDCTNKTP